MPPVIKIQKEDIVNAAYEIARKSGIEGVNARAVAKKLNCSIQPIFHNFKNMEDLKQALYEKAVKTYKEYMTKGVDSDYSYKSIGINYIRLAKEEPNIFKMLFMRETNMTLESFMAEDKAYEYIESTIATETKMDKKTILKFHEKMWFFTHGIATLVADKTCNLTENEINEFLVEEFFALMKLEEFKQTEDWKNILNYIKQTNKE